MTDTPEQTEPPIIVESNALGRMMDEGKSLESIVTGAPKPAKAEPEAPADPTPETPAAPPAEDEAGLPEWMRKRIARAARQRDDERRRADETAAKLEEAQSLLDKLAARTTGLNPNDFPDIQSFREASAALVKAKEKPPAPDPVDAEVAEAIGDLREAVTVADPALWAKVSEVDKDGNPTVNNISRPMVLALADLDAPAPALAALVAMTDEQRGEIASMTARGARKAIMALAKAAPAPAATPATPPKDPATGRFVPRTSQAPDPIEPLGAGSAPLKPLSDVSTSEYIARRDAEEKGVKPSLWL